jgi:2-methylaconitate cis-trans-isomerase PrpF
VSYSANCGNLSAAVGVYAIEEGMIEAVDPVTTVRIYNTNTRQILIAHVPVIRGAPAVKGNYAISGVPGSGAEIRLDFSQTSGATTGSMLPSGNLQDDLYVPELGKTIRVSFVDVAKATVYFRAADLAWDAGARNRAGLW